MLGNLLYADGCKWSSRVIDEGQVYRVAGILA
jgi:hypothetical protein